MKLTTLAGFLCLAALAGAQQVRFDYDRSANFSAYKTYQWAGQKAGQNSNQLMHQNFQRAVDEQLAMKGMRRVTSGGDVQVAYSTAFAQEKRFDAWGTGPRFRGSAQVTSSTIETGKLVVYIYDPAKNQLVWRGEAEKTLTIQKDPEKNYRNLEKAMAKLFKNYPPGSAKK